MHKIYVQTHAFIIIGEHIYKVLIYHDNINRTNRQQLTAPLVIVRNIALVH